MPDRPDASIIIVSYNTRELLRECLESLRGTDSPVRADTGLDKNVQATIEIIVIDNASADGSAQMVAECFPEVKLIANSENRGFGAACNQGLEIAQGRYALILNADIRAEAGALQRLVAFMDAHPDAVACGGQLRYPDGRIQPSCARELTLWWVFCEQSLLAKLFPRTRLFGGYWRTYWDFSSTIETEQVMGACLMLRPCGTDIPVRAPEDNADTDSNIRGTDIPVRAPENNAGTDRDIRGTDIPVRAIDDSAGTDRNVRATQSSADTDKNVRATGFPLFDETYFLYCEDTDLCYRIRQAGGKIYYVHDAVFVHHLGASGEPQRAAMVIYYNRGKERYFRKFHGEWQARVCRLLNKLGALLRVLIGVGGMLFTLGRSQKAKQYTKVFWEVLLRS